MALLFDDATPDYYYTASTPITGVPLTISCWFWSDDLTIDQTLVSVTDDTDLNDYFSLYLAGGQTGDYVRMASRHTSAGFAATTLAYSANTWQHALGSVTSDTQRDVWLNNANTGSNTTSIIVDTCTAISLGTNKISTGSYLPLSGALAEVGIWNVADLTADERAALASGVPCNRVRPQSLKFYVRGITSSNVFDIRGQLALSSSGTPTTATHGPSLKPFSRSNTLVVPTSTITIPRLQAYYNRVRAG